MWKQARKNNYDHFPDYVADSVQLHPHQHRNQILIKIINVNMKLWEKGINPEPAIIEFTAGKDRKTDLALTKWDIIGSMAHVIMLDDVGLISEDEKNELVKSSSFSFCMGRRRKSSD